MLRNFVIILAQVLKQAGVVLKQALIITLQQFIAPASGLADVIVGTRSRKPPTLSYDERMARVSSQLSASAAEAQRLFEDLEQTLSARRAAVVAAEQRMAELTKREATVRDQIAALEQSNPEAAKAFTALMERAMNDSEKRSRFRDLILFGIGVAVSVAIQIAWGFFTGEI